MIHIIKLIIIAKILIYFPIICLSQNNGFKKIYFGYKISEHISDTELGIKVGHNSKSDIFILLKFGQFYSDREIKLKKNDKAFKIGKINNIYQTNIGVSFIKSFKELPMVKSQLFFKTSLNGGLIIIKPYYLDLIYYSIDSFGMISETIISEKYSEHNKSFFTNPNNIYTKSNWYKGINELSLNYNIDYSVEVGISKLIFKDVLWQISLGFSTIYANVQYPMIVNETFKKILLDGFLRFNINILNKKV